MADSCGTNPDSSLPPRRAVSHQHKWHRVKSIMEIYWPIRRQQTPLPVASPHFFFNYCRWSWSKAWLWFHVPKGLGRRVRITNPWRRKWLDCAVLESTSPSIFFFPPFYFWFWKRNYFFPPSPFFSIQVRGTILIWNMSTNFSIPLRYFLYHGFLWPDHRTHLI